MKKTTESTTKLSRNLLLTNTSQLGFESPCKKTSSKYHSHLLPFLHRLIQFSSCLLLFSHSFFVPCNAAMTSQRKLELRDLVKQTWYHGFGNYMEHAFPKDELAPISCRGMGPDHENPQNSGRNDVLGDFSLTLIDSIDTFIALRDYKNFELAVLKIIKTIPNFDLNSKVQVFETTIRVLGGLLSGHLFAKNPSNFFNLNNKNDLYNYEEGDDGEILFLKDYKDELLFLAHDLADRMLPAFEASKTGIPFARVNLRYGVIAEESTETCTAGAGSLLLEFATLSRLIGDSKYENVAKKAFYALWDRRSKISLLGNTIDLQTGQWSYGISSIGAGIDSFYEYILKSHILLQDDSLLDLWNEAYKAATTYMKSSDGFWHRGVNMHTGAVATTTIDSLAAFWPGLQVLAGDIEAAIKSHMVYTNLWARYSGIPEVFNMHIRQATALAYPLRPEFIESNYFLYRATKDEYYLEVAERVITDLVNRTWVDCGLASIENLETGELDDHMHSFMLSETLKYLYLTFDEDNPINHLDEPFIFTTEGHILYIPNAQDFAENQRYSNDEDFEELESLDSDRIAKVKHPKKEKKKVKSDTCQVFSPSIGMKNSKYSSQFKFSVTGRTDFEYAKMITGTQDLSITISPNLNPSHPSSSLDGHLNPAQPAFDNSWLEFGFCEVPSLDDNLIELSFTRSDEDLDPVSITDQVTFFQVPIKDDENQIQSNINTEGAYNAQNRAGDQASNHDQNTKSFAVVKNLTGLTFSLKKSPNSDTYEIVNIGTRSLPKKTTVILSDPYAVKALKPQKESEKLSERDRAHVTAIRVSYEDTTVVEGEESRRTQVIDRVVMMAAFGPDVKKPGSTELSVGKPPLELVQLPEFNHLGCLPIDHSVVDGKVVLIKRGDCTFADKLQHSVAANAKGVIIFNQDSSLIIPTSDRIEARDNLKEKENLNLNQLNIDTDVDINNKLKSIPLLFSNFETGQLIQNLLNKNKSLFIQIGVNHLDLLDNHFFSSSSFFGDDNSPSDQTQKQKHPPQPIAINGYRLSNLILKSE